jgi:plastocyanin
MTLLSRIFFSAALAFPGFAATLSGRVELVDSRTSSARQHHDYSGVAVWLEPVGPALAPAPPLHVRMLQKDKTFQPHLLIVTVGSTVDFPNLDPVFHNAFSNYDGQLFDIGLYPPGSTRSVRFSRPGIVRVFCNIHSSMSAVIVVLDTPLFGVTKADGHFEIEGVPEGEGDLTFFHERASQAALRSAGRRISFKGENVSLPPVSISETGYLSMPHKNKYGQDYPPAADDAGFYPATHK